MIDAHAHVGDPKFDNDRGAALDRAAAAGLGAIVCVGQNTDTARRALAVKRGGHPKLKLAATAGLHPHEAANAAAELPALLELAKLPEIDAVGETGLDFYYNHSPRDAQRDAFRWHLDIAKKLHKPVVVHVRDAHPEALEDITKAGPDAICMIHCFTGGPAEARKYLDLGCYISFSGILTFPTAAAIREAARIVPEDRLLVETDCPFLSPEGFRGKRCEPAFIINTARVLAEVRGTAVEAVDACTSRNAMKLFFNDRPPL
ncbi:MAG: TatD family hydrolase [Planctomycetes bacterium]|nr:TatD family hydrolase [Planctomycetota bacterium]